MCLEKISTIEDAIKILVMYLPKYNKKLEV